MFSVFNEHPTETIDDYITVPSPTSGSRLENKIKLLQTEAEFNEYKENGIFENVVYTWTFENGFYTVKVDLESNKQFYSNMKGIL